MVYGGKPSTGCYLCRKRKIKCDEALPQCRNCLVYGQPCPGYRLETIFRNETSKIAQLVKRSGSSPPGNPRRQAGLEISTGSSLSLLPRVVDSSWEERAICYFFDQFTTGEDTGECVSYLSFLPSLYATVCREKEGGGTPAASCLRLAVDATALITLSNHVKAPALTLRSRELYGRALRSLRQALNSLTQAVKDETFTTLVLLSLFEDIAGERNGLSSPHAAGFGLLMKMRGEGQLGHAQGRDLFHIAYAHTHVEILALREKPKYAINPDWILGKLNGTDPVERLILIASKISQLVLATTSSFHGSGPTLSLLDAKGMARLTTWIETGRQIDLELGAWTQQLPERWLPLIVFSQKSGEPLITYQHISISSIWTYYRAIRIILHQLMLELRRALATAALGEQQQKQQQQHCHQAQDQDQAQFRDQHQDTDHPPIQMMLTLDDPGVPTLIQKMITDVCRSIPFSFGEVDSLGNPSTSSTRDTKTRVRAFSLHGMIWPVWYILSSGMATPSQAQQLRGFLTRIGSVLGIKLALTLAGDTLALPHGQIISSAIRGG